MKFYDLEWLADKCGTDNKYEITVKVAAEARRESEETQIERGTPGNERYISNVLLEIEEGKSPINAQKEKTLDDLLEPQPQEEQQSQPETKPEENTVAVVDE